MKAINELRKRRALSPVIATVIIVAVTITVAVAVSYWLSGITSSYTSFEKIEIQTGYAENVGGVPDVHYTQDEVDADLTDDITSTDQVKTPGSTAGWTIILVLKNSGTTSSTLINCFINEKLVAQIDGPLAAVTCTGSGGGVIGEGLDGITIESGFSETITILGFNTDYSSSGTTINVKLHSASGMDYIRLLQLP